MLATKANSNSVSDSPVADPGSASKVRQIIYKCCAVAIRFQRSPLKSVRGSEKLPLIKVPLPWIDGLIGGSVVHMHIQCTTSADVERGWGN